MDGSQQFPHGFQMYNHTFSGSHQDVAQQSQMYQNQTGHSTAFSYNYAYAPPPPEQYAMHYFYGGNTGTIPSNVTEGSTTSYRYQPPTVGPTDISGGTPQQLLADPRSQRLPLSFSLRQKKRNENVKTAVLSAPWNKEASSVVAQTAVETEKTAIGTEELQLDETKARTENSSLTNRSDKASTPSWPPSLRDYVERSFRSVTSTEDKEKLHDALKELISKYAKQNKLWEVDWQTHPLPLAQKDKADLRRQISNTTSSKQAAGRHDKEKKGKKRKKLNLDIFSSSKTELSSEKATDKRRKERFGSEIGGRTSTSARDSFSLRSLTMENGEDWWEGAPVKGLSESLEKPYLRLTGVPNPKLVRPKRVLKKSLALAKRKWLEREERRNRGESIDYHSVSEQLKAIRQDLTVQHIKDFFSISVYETHARLALENGDISEFNQCQTKLKELYEEDWYKGAVNGPEGEQKNFCEFLAYRILYCVCRQDWRMVMHEILKMSVEVKRHPAIKHALAVREAVARENYFRIFKLYRMAPFMSAFVLDLNIATWRYQCLRMLVQVMRPTIGLQFVTEVLGFSSIEQAESYVLSHGGVVVSSTAGLKEIDARASTTKISEFVIGQTDVGQKAAEANFFRK